MKRSIHNIPFAPARFPVFYGWVLMLVGSLGFVMSVPGQTYGVAPFTEPLISALDLSRVALSKAYMFGTMASACILIYAGKLYDRFGARCVAPAACLIMGATLLTLSQIDLRAARLAGLLPGLDSADISFGAILLGFFALRFSAQGVLTLVSLNMVMKWFDRHRGLVTGIMGVFTGPVFSLTPKMLSALVDAVGWREAWVLLALVCGLGFSLISLLFYRDAPEDCGLVPDGKAPSDDRPSPEKQRVQFTPAEARRTYAFWAFALTIATSGCFMTAVGFHIFSVFESAGRPGATGYDIFLPAAMITLVLRPLVGWLCDVIELKYLLMVLALSIGGSGLGLSLLALPNAHWIMIVSSGIGGSTFGTLLSVTFPNYYGRKHLGAISGTCMSIMVFASALGPWAFGHAKQATGDYSIAGWLTIVASLVLFVAAFRANSPQPGVQRT